MITISILMAVIVTLSVVIITIALHKAGYYLGRAAERKAIEAWDKAAADQAKELEKLEHDTLAIPQFELVTKAERDEIDLHLTRIKTDEQTLEASLINPDCVECSGTRYVAGYVVYRLVRDTGGWCPTCTSDANNETGLEGTRAE